MQLSPYAKGEVAMRQRREPASKSMTALRPFSHKPPPRAGFVFSTIRPAAEPWVGVEAIAAHL
jgi:hypothetical protein